MTRKRRNQVGSFPLGASSSNSLLPGKSASQLTACRWGGRGYQRKVFFVIRGSRWASFAKKPARKKGRGKDHGWNTGLASARFKSLRCLRACEGGNDSCSFCQLGINSKHGLSRFLYVYVSCACNWRLRLWLSVQSSRFTLIYSACLFLSLQLPFA